MGLHTLIFFKNREEEEDAYVIKVMYRGDMGEIWGRYSEEQEDAINVCADSTLSHRSNIEVTSIDVTSIDVTSIGVTSIGVTEQPQPWPEPYHTLP